MLSLGSVSKMILSLMIACLICGSLFQPGIWTSTLAQETTAQKKIAIVWTSADPDVAHRMVLMYGHAAKKAGWFDEVRIIVWGPSARLLAGDKDLQKKLAAMKADGVILQACIVCADSYGVTETLRGFDIEVKPMGAPLSELILDPSVHVVTF
jgi:hypothetical protein